MNLLNLYVMIRGELIQIGVIEVCPTFKNCLIGMTLKNRAAGQLVRPNFHEISHVF